MLWRTRYRIREFLAASIWPLPTAIVILASFLANGTGSVDDAVADESNDVTSALATFTEGAATTLLSSIAGAMITFTGFVFAVLLLVVQFGSAQFTPRVLRTVYSDRLTQVTLGVFVGTFVFALSTLARVGEELPATFSINIAILLVLASVILFIALISRTARRMRATTIADRVVADGLAAIGRAYPPLEGRADPEPEATPATEPRPPDLVSRLGRSGYLQVVNSKGLMRLAAANGVEISLRRGIGDYVTSGAGLFEVRGGTVSARLLRRSVIVRDERTSATDPAFALRVLADIANKALSPGVNDPTTAVQTIDRIEILLEELSARELPSGRSSDSDGTVRLHVPTATWRDLLELGVGEIHQYGRSSAQVTRRLRAALLNLMTITPEGDRQDALREQLARIDRLTEREFPDELDRSQAAAADWQGLGLSRSAG